MTELRSDMPEDKDAVMAKLLSQLVDHIEQTRILDNCYRRT